jgi:hypothetical protein
VVENGDSLNYRRFRSVELFADRIGAPTGRRQFLEEVVIFFGPPARSVHSGRLYKYFDPRRIISQVNSPRCSVLLNFELATAFFKLGPRRWQN